MSQLKQTLAAFQKEFESGSAPYHVKPQQVDVMHKFDGELRATGILESAPRPGDVFPSFMLKNHDGQPVDLKTLLARGPVVVSFFRGVWCPYCNIELKALQDAFAEIESTGSSLIAISPQLPASNRQAVRQNNLGFDILTDIGNQLAESLGLTYCLSEELIEKVYKPFGTLLPKFNGDESWRLPLSSRFVIDIDGVIISAEVDVNYRTRPEPSETVAILKAITRRSLSA